MLLILAVLQSAASSENESYNEKDLSLVTLI